MMLSTESCLMILICCSLPLKQQLIERDHIYRLGKLTTHSYLGKLKKSGSPFTQPATRHTQLLAMVGFLVVRCSHDVALEFANWQFDTKTVETNADLSQHLADFESIWAWFLSQWRPTLTESERNKFERLTTDTERDAFRIIRDLHRSASHSGGAEFPISRDSLAARLQITGVWAGKLRFRFCGNGDNGR
jgi:hypothetical protein